MKLAWFQEVVALDSRSMPVLAAAMTPSTVMVIRPVEMKAVVAPSSCPVRVISQ